MIDNTEIRYFGKDECDFPKILYKYRDWKSPYHKKILLENKIYFSPPKEFDDKLDCNVPTKYPHKRELYHLFLQKSKQENPLFSRLQHRAFARNLSVKSPLANPKKLEKLIIEKNDEFNTKCGIFSATEDFSNIDMWAAYSNDSQGICIGFDTEKLFKLHMAGKDVEYVDELPIIDFINDEIDDKLIKNIFYKEKRYSFEKEYRLMKFWEDGANDDERNISMLDDCIVEVILGKNITDNDKQEIIELVKEKYPKVIIKESTI